MKRLAVAAMLVVVAGCGKPPPIEHDLASLSHAGTGDTIDDVACESHEQTNYHVHAHLSIYVDGHTRGIPAGIGIAPPRQTEHSPQGDFVAAGSCFYHLHTHTADGIVHIESPVKFDYTLGQFFDIWGVPLGTNRLDGYEQAVTAYVNGQRSNGDPSKIVLSNHTDITLEAGKLVTPKAYSWPKGY